MNKNRIDSALKISLIIFVEGFLLTLLVMSFASNVIGGIIGLPNATVQTKLQVGYVAPEILNITIDNYSTSITLVPNSTQNVSCQALLRDWNNNTNITGASTQFFEQGVGTYNGPDANNYHYTNNSCDINRSFGSWNGIQANQYLALATCNYSIWYYADPGVWNCTMNVSSLSGLTATGSNVTNISNLLAIALPSVIDYGTINATYVSPENATNVTNVGNTALNLSLYGYGATPNDGLAMNCSLGQKPYINISYERYNITTAHPNPVSLSQFAINYTNLTTSAVVRDFQLNYRHNDTFNHAYNATYWRIYVPKEVAGTCTGHIVFGAIVAPGA